MTSPSRYRKNAGQPTGQPAPAPHGGAGALRDRIAEAAVPVLEHTDPSPLDVADAVLPVVEQHVHAVAVSDPGDETEAVRRLEARLRQAEDQARDTERERERLRWDVDTARYELTRRADAEHDVRAVLADRGPARPEGDLAAWVAALAGERDWAYDRIGYLSGQVNRVVRERDEARLALDTLRASLRTVLNHPPTLGTPGWPPPGTDMADPGQGAEFHRDAGADSKDHVESALEPPPELTERQADLLRSRSGSRLGGAGSPDELEELHRRGLITSASGLAWITSEGRRALAAHQQPRPTERGAAMLHRTDERSE